jgi:small subunit ribosomal protein S4
MGHPKKQRRKYSRPKRPYDRERLERERKLKTQYGLRRKKEIWRSEEVLRNFRQRARELQASPDEKKEKELIDKMKKIGLRVATLDDVLTAKLDDILARRLQTVIVKKGIANTAKQARQLIVHGHILVEGRKIKYPSFIVEAGDEEKVSITSKMATKLAAKPEEKAE